MDKIGVVMTCPMSTYLERELNKHFTLFQLWHNLSRTEFLNANSISIKIVVGDAAVGADIELIESLPNLEIVATNSVGLDKIDLRKCEEKGVRVTNTPDVLTDDVADLAIALILGVLSRVCEADGFVRSGEWRCGDFGLATKFSGKSVGIIGLG